MTRPSGFLLVAVVAILGAAVDAQTVAPLVPATVQTAPSEFPRLSLTAGRSRVVTVDFDVTRFAVTNPAVADAVVVAPREVLVDGKGAGTTSLIVWGGGQRVQYDVVVDAGSVALEQALATLFPGDAIRVAVSDKVVVLSGTVAVQATVLRAGEIAAGAYPDFRVVNMLSAPGGQSTQQVMIQVRFAEVSRTGLRELGAAAYSSGRYTTRSTTQQFAAPEFSSDSGTVGELVFSDFLNLLLLDRNNGIGAVVRALQERGQFQSLAEPNLIAYNGQEASFLAGGEFPVPIVQGVSGAVNVQFKEFGVRLSFKPTIAGDTIRLRVRPEVSTLAFSNGITLSGIRIPGLTTRRAETEVELRDGQSFAIAGLLSNQSEITDADVPWLSRIPIIGALFRSRADRRERNELFVLITPRLVRPLDPDDVPAIPMDGSRFLPDDELPARPASTPPTKPTGPGGDDD